MATIKKKFIGANQVDESKIRLSNNANLRARNAADSGDVSILKVNASDKIEFASLPQASGSPSANADLVNKGALDTALGSYIPTSQKGANSGVATLDSGGKIPVTQLPNSVMEFQGAWNASTNSPTLADGTGNAGDVYRVSVAGSQDLGSGSQSFVIGDFVMYSGSIWQKSPGTDAVVSVNGQTGVVSLSTDNVSEGSTNKYFTDTRAKTAAVLNTLAGSETDQAPSVSAVNTALSGKEPANANIQSHISSTSNPHSVTKTQVGLGNVTNDAQVKAVGSAVVSGNFVSFNGTSGDSVQDSGSKAADFATAGHNHSGVYEPANANIQSHISSTSNPHSVTKTQVGLGNVTDDAQLKAADLDTDGTLAANSDSKIPSQKAVKTYVASQIGAAAHHRKDEILTLSSGDITNQFVELAHAATASDAISLFAVGGPMQERGVDFTISLTGGTGGVTKISFSGDLATGGAAELVAGDKLVISYDYI